MCTEELLETACAQLIVLRVLHWYLLRFGCQGRSLSGVRGHGVSSSLVCLFLFAEQCWHAVSLVGKEDGLLVSGCLVCCLVGCFDGCFANVCYIGLFVFVCCVCLCADQC